MSASPTATLAGSYLRQTGQRASPASQSARRVAECNDGTSAPPYRFWPTEHPRPRPRRRPRPVRHGRRAMRPARPSAGCGGRCGVPAVRGVIHQTHMRLTEQGTIPHSTQFIGQITTPYCTQSSGQIEVTLYHTQPIEQSTAPYFKKSTEQETTPLIT